jgi:hypothetical protein
VCFPYLVSKLYSGKPKKSRGNVAQKRGGFGINLCARFFKFSLDKMAEE